MTNAAKTLPAYWTKPYEELTAAERAEMERDMDDAAAEYQATHDRPEFPHGEFAPQCNIGPCW